MSTSDDNLIARGAAAEGSVELRIQSDPRMLKVVRTSVSQFCALVGFSPEECNSIMLAVDEACSNIIKHTYDGRTDQPIVVRCEALPDGIRIVLRDFGDKVKLSTIKSRDLHDVRPGGLGVHLIRSVMDDVRFDESCKVGNRLMLVKYFRGQKEDV